MEKRSFEDSVKSPVDRPRKKGPSGRGPSRRSLALPALCALAVLGGTLMVDPNLPFHSAQAAGLTPGAAHDIVVQGEAVTAGDLTTFLDVTVKGEGKTGGAAEKAATGQEAAVERAVAAVGVKGDGISAGPFHLAPSPGTGGEGGFVATRTLRLPLPQKATMGDVVDAATQAGAASASGIVYVTRPADPGKIRRLIADAAKDARQNALSTAEALGLRLGPPERISVLSEGPRPTPTGRPGWGVKVEVTFGF